MCHMTTVYRKFVQVKCYTCGGLGEYDHKGSNPCGDTQYATCRRCKGTGIISVQEKVK